MFELDDIRKSRVWQEAHQEGREEGREEGSTLTNRQHIQRWLAEGKSLQEIAGLLSLPLAEIRRFAKRRS